MTLPYANVTGSGRRSGVACASTMLILCVVAVVTWYPLLMYNLPVCANVDERAGLGILQRFHGGSFDPNFFLYPTLYYYLTYCVTRLFSFHDVLLYGRIMNLCVGLLVALATYFFCKMHFSSRLAGILAAALTLFSPIVNKSATYLDTDVLLALFSVLGLLFWQRFFHTDAPGDWALGTLFSGLAVASKYPAFLLIAAYFIVEVLRPARARPDHGIGALLDARLPRTVLISGLIVLSGVVLCAGLFFPVDAALRFIAHNRLNLTPKTNAEYLQFFSAIRLRMMFAGALGVVLSVVLYLFPALYRRCSVLRPFVSTGAALVLLVATSAFCVIAWRRCLYDLGAQMKATVVVVSGEAQWLHYLRWYSQSESLVAASFLVVGVALLLCDRSRYMLLLIYLALYVLVLGKNRIGFPRYLTPVLPLLFSVAAYGATVLFNRLRRLSPALAYCGLAVLLLTAGLEVHMKVHALRITATSHDSLYRSYWTTVGLRPTRVYYAGVAPYAELQMAGLDVREITKQQTEQPSFLESIGPEDLLIVDHLGSRQPHTAPPGMKVIESDPESYGQDIYKPSVR